MIEIPQLTSLPAAAAAVSVVTLVTVILPSPTLVAASRLGVVRGPRSVAAFLGTVLLMDVAVFSLLAFGFQPLLARLGTLSWLIPLGGLALVLLGGAMALSARGGAPAANDLAGRAAMQMNNPFLAGVVVPIANPGFWIWWTTAGAGFIHLSTAWGHAGLATVFTAYLLSVGAWYACVVVALSHGRGLLPPTAVHGIQVGLGVVMVGLGLVVVLRHMYL